MQVKSKVWLEKDGELCFGSGKARILRAVAATGSLNQAARELGMSYRHAWTLMRVAEQRLGKPLLIRTRGGSGRGGAVLTDYAKDVLERFEQMDREVREFVDERHGAAFGH